MPEVVAAGHLCLDIIPSFLSAGVMLEPGTLSEVGPVTFSTGGAVSNVGLALHKLGVTTSLVGRVGDDDFGVILRRLLSAQLRATGGVVVAPGESTSYTVVLSPPDTDRIFLHHPGCNDTFAAADVDISALAGARAFYFGYPPIMRAFYSDGGRALAGLLREIRARGVTTVLDMAMPDPRSASGRVDWPAFLARVLPHADLFMPSLEETLFMLAREAFANKVYAKEVPPEALLALCRRLLALGAGAVGLKLGERGLYLVSAGRERVARLGAAVRAPVAALAERELWSPCFKVKVEGTTGAGDATVAGFVAALLRGLGFEEALAFATAVGACSVEAADATGGVRPWEETLARMKGGWPRAGAALQPAYWARRAPWGVCYGPHDASRRGKGER
jgi:sugar/nucleoside kinase (ribokinase family)